MKLIKKDSTVIMKVYDVEELEKDTKQDVVQGFINRSNGEFYQWSRSDVIDHIKANEYLFTKKGEMLLITRHYKLCNLVKTTMEIAGEEVEIEIENAGVKRVKQITIDVQLEGESVDHIDEIKSHIIEEIEFSIENLLNVEQVGDLRFIDLTKEYNLGHKEDLN